LYRLNEIEKDGLSYVKLISPSNKSKAEICLTQGARLSCLFFNDIELIANCNASDYNSNYASAILFPFANRIKNGSYNFDGLDYNLTCNEIDKNNAIHGLVFDKKFTMFNSILTSTYALVCLSYEDNGHNTGYPFKYKIELDYLLNKKGIQLSVKIKNTDKTPLPFTLGWHPYFSTQSLDQSTICFTCNTKYITDNQLIITDKIKFNTSMPLALKDAKLDDGYKLDSNTVEFSTPNYKMLLESSIEKNYLQLYTPKTPNLIAIEAMTGVCDSFNNEIGLQVLQPNGIYRVEWTLTINTN